MAGRNKLLQPVRGVPVVRGVVIAALASKANPVVVVTGHEAEEVGTALRGLDVTVVHNPRYAEGLSTSIAAGVRALPGDLHGALICLGDMPEICAAHLDALIAAFAPEQGRSIIVPTHRGQRGNPVLWAASFFPELQQLTGDAGARHLLAHHREQVAEVAFASDAVLIDVDTPEALARVQKAERE